MTDTTINPLWRIASRGRPSTWATPEEAWLDAVAYFQWADSNPLQEEKLHMFQGEIIRSKVDKIRPYTIGGFQLHAGISDSTWYKYKNDSHFSGVIEQIEKCIKEQKFAGAVAELMNPNIIARDLGLSDKQELTASVQVSTLDAESLSDQTLSELLAARAKSTDKVE